MSGGEIAFIILVVAAMLSFASVLAWAARSGKDHTATK